MRGLSLRCFWGWWCYIWCVFGFFVVFIESVMLLSYMVWLYFDRRL